MGVGDINFIAGASGGGSDASGYINIVADYGADPTGVADSATALTDAIAAVLAEQDDGQPGIWFPPGIYKIASQIDIAAPLTKTLRNITFLSAGNGFAEGGATTLRFENTDLDYSLKLTSVLGMHFKGFHFENAGGSGSRDHCIVMNANASPSLSMNQIVFEDCSFTPDSSHRTDKAYIECVDSVQVEFRNCEFTDNQQGINIGDADGGGSFGGGFSNNIGFIGCRFEADVIYNNAGNVTFDTCIFQANDAAGGRSARFFPVGSEQSLRAAVFMSCWFGKTGTTTSVDLLTIGAGTVTRPTGGVMIVGCRFSTGRYCINSLAANPGLSVKACHFDDNNTGTNAVRLQNMTSPSVDVSANFDEGSWSDKFLHDTSGDYGNQQDGNRGVFPNKN